jgi:GTP-binding protein Era
VRFRASGHHRVTDATRCGYVALVGRPNVGKSTLLNHLLGRKLAITSRRPQTTRHVLLGVDTRDDCQAIWVDTPGIHEAGARALNRFMVRSATAILADVDIVVMLVERLRWTDEDALVLRHVRAATAPKLCAITKIDELTDRLQLLPQIDSLREKAPFDAIVPISALRDLGVEDLRTEVHRRLPSGPHLFPADQITDRSERFIAAEIVREKLSRQLGDELPHRIAVLIDRYTAAPKLVSIDATIYVEREGQKAIVIGRGGSRLKSVGQEARHDIEKLVGTHVMLRLWVKVKAGWTRNEAVLRRLGLD